MYNTVLNSLMTEHSTNGRSTRNGSCNVVNNNTDDNFSISSSILKTNHDRDVVRLIVQHLIGMGLKQSVDLLLEESGLNVLDHPVATKLQQDIMNGNWEGADSLVEAIAAYSNGDRKSTINELRLLIAQQKFLEFIEDNQPISALKCLRAEITPLTSDSKQAQHLATLLMCKSIEEVRSKANWPGKGPQSRQALMDKIQRFIPPPIMLPAKRLNTLLSQAVEMQKERCVLHITKTTDGEQPQPEPLESVDLKIDHYCSADKFPLQTVQELDNHKTEIWFCKFSNDGTKLATGGIGGNVIIWDVDPGQRKLIERCTLPCDSYSIACLSWSPNDVYLLACGSEDTPDLYVWNVDKKDVCCMIKHSDEESTTTCSWHMSGEKFAAASIKGNFHIYDLNGGRLGSREGVRVQCLSFLHKDPNIILAADTLNRIKSYVVKDMSLETPEEDVLEEKHSIMSFTIDQDDRYIALNLMEQGVHLWDLKLKTLLRMFPGVCQRDLTIYSSFSSPDASFIASGSEDGRVYIYKMNRDQPVAILHGHSRCVNCVTWNPKFPELLVSVSDDRAVRLWAPTSNLMEENAK